MSRFPIILDDDTDLPPINGNITEIGGEAINSTRDAIFNIESNIGINANGVCNSISERLNISLSLDGTIKPSAIASMGLVTLPIYNNEIADNAAILESKLKLDYKTQDLYNFISKIDISTDNTLGWISLHGIKVEPHISGSAYNHGLDQILSTSNSTSYPYLKNVFNTYRNFGSLNITNAYSLISDINNEVIYHQQTDSYPSNITNSYTASRQSNIITHSGTSYPSNYGHTAAGIFINTNPFSIIPQTTTDLQRFVEYIDTSGEFINSDIVKNLYTSGVSRVSRSLALLLDGYGNIVEGLGKPVVPTTPAIAYLTSSSTPIDSTSIGDNIIEFKPTTGNIFDAQFTNVVPGDIVTIDYGVLGVNKTTYIIIEKQYIAGSKYIVRINGKNLAHSIVATAKIDKSSFNDRKEGVLAIAAVNSPPISGGPYPSLIIGAPRGAQAIGLGFNADLFDGAHFNLYLELYPNGSPSSGYVLVPVDVTGDQGISQGEYTLERIVEQTNIAFRQPWYNYRFIAFAYNGEFGIMLADSYNNASFSIIYESSGYTAANVVPNGTDSDMFTDPLGFGPFKANIAGPKYTSSYSNVQLASQNATKIFIPLRKNNYYVSGREIEKLAIEPTQFIDNYGDGYWAATVYNVISSNIPNNQILVKVIYRIPDLILSSSNLTVGKTIVIQSLTPGISDLNFGRFIIDSIDFGCDGYTNIEVYNAIHGTGMYPNGGIIPIGTLVAIYFNSSSVSFSNENAFDAISLYPTYKFKRYFETYIDNNGKTFSYERGRILISPPYNLNINPYYYNIYSSINLINLDIISISPKLRAYSFGSINKVSLSVTCVDGYNYNGYLCRYDYWTQTTPTRLGPITLGKIGEVARFYNNTYIDYIDIIFNFDPNHTIVASPSAQYIDIQLFPSLSLDNDVMLLATCQVDDSTGNITNLRDQRQFGNISEKDLSTSALNYIALPERLLHSNGVIRGFDLITSSNDTVGINYGQLYLKGGVAVVNGNIYQINDSIVTIPFVSEYYNSIIYDINWALCINNKGEYESIALLDYDQNTNNPNNPSRLLQVQNMIYNNQYNIDSTTFSNLINNRKDLCILYVIHSSISASEYPPTIGLITTDSRRYINDSENNLSIKYTNNKTQGNFKNTESIFNWLRFNGNFNSDAFIGGISASDGYVNYAISLTPTKSMVIDGQNNCNLTFNNMVYIGSNITFKGLNITFNRGLNVLSHSSNVIFENCNFDFVSNNSFIINNNATDITINNCTINNCSFILQANATNIKINNSDFNNIDSLNILSYSNNVIFESCNFDFIFVSHDSFIISDNATDVTINNCTVNNCNFTIQSDAENIKISNSNFNFAYNSFTLLSNITNLLIDSCVINNSDFILGSNSTNIKINNSSFNSILGSNFIIGQNSTKLYIDNCIIYNFVFNLAQNSTNIKLNNSNIVAIINEATTIYPSTNVFDFSNSSNVDIENCNISITYSNIQDYHNYNIFKLNYAHDCRFINNNVNITYSINNLISTKPGVVFNCSQTNNVIIKDGYYNGNFWGAVYFSDSSNLNIDNIFITSSFDPTVYTDWFTLADLVNNGHGFVYGSIDNITKNININNTKFYYSPIVNNTIDNRFSFINIMLTTINSQLDNLKITNCDFNGNPNILTTLDDKRAAIAIINTFASTSDISNGGELSNSKPILLNCLINNNRCNKNQSIIITSKLNNGVMNLPGLLAQNCTISNNYCGSIGYCIACSYNPINDKNSGLFINNNTCHYIATINDTGYYTNSTMLTYSSYSTGNVTISNNNVNWIHIRYLSMNDDASLLINKNHLTPYDGYQYIIGSNFPILENRTFNNYAIYVDSYISNSVPMGCIIDGNIIDAFIYNTTLNSYIYNDGFIACMAGGIISNNLCTAPVGINSKLFYVQSCTQILNNTIYRNNVVVKSYIYSYWNGTEEGYDPISSLICNNYFDDPTIDGINYKTIDVAWNWIVKNNVNHTLYTTIDAGINPGGRLTISSTDPIADGSSTILYYLPYLNDKASIFYVSNINNVKSVTWRQYTVPSSGLSLSFTQGVGCYDVFLTTNFLNSNSDRSIDIDKLTLSTTKWASNSSRGYTLHKVDGVLVDSIEMAVYLGTVIIANIFGHNIIMDSTSTRGIWNYYNGINKSLFVMLPSYTFSNTKSYPFTDGYDSGYMSLGPGPAFILGMPNQFLNIELSASLFATVAISDQTLHTLSLDGTDYVVYVSIATAIKINTSIIDNVISPVNMILSKKSVTIANGSGYNSPGSGYNTTSDSVAVRSITNSSINNIGINYIYPLIYLITNINGSDVLTAGSTLITSITIDYINNTCSAPGITGYLKT